MNNLPREVVILVYLKYPSWYCRKDKNFTSPLFLYSPQGVYSLTSIRGRRLQVQAGRKERRVMDGVKVDIKEIEMTVEDAGDREDWKKI